MFVVHFEGEGEAQFRGFDFACGVAGFFHRVEVIVGYFIFTIQEESDVQSEEETEFELGTAGGQSEDEEMSGVDVVQAGGVVVGNRTDSGVKV